MVKLNLPDKTSTYTSPYALVVPFAGGIAGALESRFIATGRQYEGR